MYWQYTEAVIRRALQPTVRITDGLQILAASAIPAAADATGLPVPETNSVLAYIGAAAVAFIVLRLLFVAPFQVWREQVGELGSLRLELLKPEQIEFARMARGRAKKRVRLAGLVSEMHWHSFTDKSEGANKEIERRFAKGLSLMGQAGVSESFVQAFMVFSDYCSELNKDRRGKPCDKEKASRSFTVSDHMIEYLHGKITGEALALRLHADIVKEKQP